jgi:multicomponent Na+:H+ antiporter subunit C
MSFNFALGGFAVLFSIGLCGAILWGNLLKKMVCLSIFSNSIIIFYLLLAYLYGSIPPITHDTPSNLMAFANPLPSVLMLTAIVVGISVQALAFSLVIRIKKDYGTLEEDEIIKKVRLD